MAELLLAKTLLVGLGFAGSGRQVCLSSQLSLSGSARHPPIYSILAHLMLSDPDLVLHSPFAFWRTSFSLIESVNSVLIESYQTKWSS